MTTRLEIARERVNIKYAQYWAAMDKIGGPIPSQTFPNITGHAEILRQRAEAWSHVEDALGEQQAAANEALAIGHE